MMLMRTDPFRDLDRWAQQVAGTAARSGWMQRNYPPETLPGGAYPEPPYVPGWDFCGVLDEDPDGASVNAGRRSREVLLARNLEPVLYKNYGRRHRSARTFTGGGDDVDSYRSVP